MKVFRGRRYLDHSSSIMLLGYFKDWHTKTWKVASISSKNGCGYKPTT
jgi:hypothetical protein